MQKPVLENSVFTKPITGYGYLYKVTSPSGKSYVGKTHKSVLSRWRSHLSNSGSHSCSALKNAILKYGPASFLVEVIGQYPTTELGNEERKAIVMHKTRSPLGYNLTDGGDGVPGCFRSPESRRKQSLKMRGRHPSKETRRKIVEGLLRRGPPSKETREKIAAAHRGKKHSPERCKANGDGHRGIYPSKETRRKMSLAMTGLKRSDETKRRMSVAFKGRVCSAATRKKLSRAQKRRFQREKKELREDI